MRFNFLILSMFTLLTYSTEFYAVNFVNYETSIVLTFVALLQTLYTWFLSVINLFYSPLIFKTLTVDAISFTLKFVITIALLVFIRGGVPRYRYDFLTKIGWIKFLSLVLLIFLSSLLLVYLF